MGDDFHYFPLGKPESTKKDQNDCAFRAFLKGAG